MLYWVSEKEAKFGVPNFGLLEITAIFKMKVNLSPKCVCIVNWGVKKRLPRAATLGVCSVCTRGLLLAALV